MFFISTTFITLFKLYSLKLFLLFFICTTFITLFKLYYPKSSILANNSTPLNNISQDEVIQLFIEWKKEYRRVYKDNEEMAKKFVTFEEFEETYIGGLEVSSEDDIELNDLPHTVPPSS
ncbi:hypothetical protein TanjilG_01174 [Lupinus angustifolius]|uniref:Cathepsin propeptide inhibitor domain-containing protein n=1 Tax=Lupinus angustifolius TaxID=3871 RepID=A0A1J7HEX0_LUPAN|nr:hypothetical protein TanjilG_01174 [Lupinus angustifolius]